MLENIKTKNLHQWLEEWAASYSERIALRWCFKNMTYQELNERANVIAWSLLEHECEMQDRIGIFLPRGFDMVAAMYAILKIGCTYVPMALNYPDERIQYIIENSKIKIVLTNEEQTVDFPRKIYVEKIITTDRKKRNLKIQSGPDDLLYIIYTSGSSGMPKGVMIKQHSLMNLIDTMNRQYQVGTDTIVLCVTSICFDLSVYDIFGVLTAGGCVIIAENEVLDVRQLIELMSVSKVNLWNSVPTTMASLIQTCEREQIILPEIKHVFLSGDWIPISLVPKIWNAMPNALVTSLGGATEATVWSIYYDILEINPAWSSIPYGKPLENQEFYILDEKRLPVAHGKEGELYIGGVGLAAGYVNDLKKTKDSFVPHFLSQKGQKQMYRTGDLGRYLQGETIEFLGRVDDQVKIRGFRIECKEVEKHIRNCDGISDCVVCVKSRPNGEKYLCGYLIVTDNFVFLEFKKALLKRLPEYMYPSVFIAIDKIPLNANGKNDQRALPAPTLNNILTQGVYQAPVGTTEEKIVSIWESVLHQTGIGMDNDFFEIGGTSLDCITLEYELKKENIHLNYEQLMEYKSVREQAMASKGLFTNNKKDVLPAMTDKKELLPFNDLYYKSCLYNALFAVVNAIGKNRYSLMANDTFYYYQKNGILEIRTKEEESLQQLLASHRIEAGFFLFNDRKELFHRVEVIMKKNGFAIIWVDSYFEPMRKDTYQKEHLAHTLLIYGKTKDGDYITFEHTHKDALNYKEKVIAKDVLLFAAEGYWEYLQLQEEYNFMEIAGETQEEDAPFVSMDQKLFMNYRQHKEQIEHGRQQLLTLPFDFLSDKEKLCLQIDWENKILDVKRGEKYRICNCEHKAEMGPLYDEIIRLWEMIRNQSIYFQKGLKKKEDICRLYQINLRQIAALEGCLMKIMSREEKDESKRKRKVKSNHKPISGV